VDGEYGKLVLEGNMTADSHGFPTSRGAIVHGGAIATLADEALASVAFTLAKEGETTVTADLKVDFLRPAQPGRFIARATVRHRTRRLAFCEASVEHAQGEGVAEARAVRGCVPPNPNRSPTSSTRRSSRSRHSLMAGRYASTSCRRPGC